MPVQPFASNIVHWYIEELTSRIVAASGIATDRYHLGKIILQSLKDAPDFVMQIDGATGEMETNLSVLERSIKCAYCFKNLGLGFGDVIVLMAPNHLDIAIPFYAAIFLGIKIAIMDKTLGAEELQRSFKINGAKVVFCQSEKARIIEEVTKKLNLKTKIVTFDSKDITGFGEFLNKYGGDSSIDDFKPTDFNPEDAIGFLIPTSGTTGLPKFASVTYKNFAITTPYLWSRFTNFPQPTRMVLVGSPLQWITAIYSFVISSVVGYTRLQTSHPLSLEHCYHLINTYKPTFTMTSPTLMTILMKPGDRERCDFTCFEQILVGGSPVSKELIEEIKKVTPNTEVMSVYGLSEITSIAFINGFSPIGSCGVPMGCFQYRLIDIETQMDIVEPHVKGELWMKGPGVFKGYYENPEETVGTFAEDGWVKTGDLFYRDENWHFYFVERIKLILKYKNYQISPMEIESVIRQHPAVLDVAVTGAPDPECGELVVACVVPRGDAQVTGNQIKDLVKGSLSESKHVRRVIFLKELPQLPSTKIDRRRLREIAKEYDI